MSASNYTVSKLAAPANPFLRSASLEGEGRWTPPACAGKATASACCDTIDGKTPVKSATKAVSLGIAAPTDPELAKAVGGDLSNLEAMIDLAADDLLRNTAVLPLSRGDVTTAVNAMRNAVHEGGLSVDVHALVQWVIRESYLESTADLYDYAQKVRLFNDQKRALRAHLSQLREIRSKLAGVDEKEAGKTRLDGKKTLGADSDAATKEAKGSDPNAPQSEKVRSMIGEFTGYKGTKGETPLEAAIKHDKAVGDRLVAAVEHMNIDQLKAVLVALGGADMRVCDDVKPFVGRIMAKLTDEQIVGLKADGGVDKDQGLGKVVNDESPGLFTLSAEWGNALTGKDSDFATAFNGRLGQAKASLEAKTGKSFGEDYKQLLDAAIAASKAKAADARQATQAGTDESIKGILTELAGRDPSEYITAADMKRLFTAAGDKLGVGDLDGQAAGRELQNIRAFYEANKSRMTPVATGVLEKYFATADQVKASGQTGISVDTYNKMRDEIHAMGNSGEDDKFIAAQKEVAFAKRQAGDRAQLESEAYTQQVVASRRQAAGRLDLDHTDGAIDAVELQFGKTEVSVVKGKKIETVAELDNEIKKLEEKLNTVGDDAQLANVDLQRMTQVQQQTLQMLSNLAKNGHDVAMAIIRNMGG